jgi:two-component system LytT family response regulator
MPGATGFDLLEQLDYAPAVVFTTAYAEHAIRSFDFNTVDYLLKPVSPERLALALRKLAGTQGGDAAAAAEALDYDSRIFIKDGGQCHLVELSAIRYIESCKNYVQVFFDGQRAYVKKSLSMIEQRLPPRDFLRVSRRHIINLHAVAGIAEAVHLGYDVTLTGGTVVEVSRRHAAALKTLLSL